MQLFSKKNLHPRKFNMAPEKWWLEDYFPCGMAYFQGLCETSGRAVIFFHCSSFGNQELLWPIQPS